ncbi:HesA/MoeB/ThiF family protein [Acidaminobacter hydrogenoformans]|uniref:Molybdopterin or thiamine biosynthesis adenylyltransferase n=1 Tax=Acidaminobacter hydrogenoformans DSM 2784 TaxID=1120920 RepID=A0A1G5S4B4_9FIRM|nr:HesA/MoeB/ThiF family protein [Acidaminobacter hydrogenoformans]SCZ81163.1 Molybdopterin or thiamine biosynthesis adenylyltransferase [Acidaminobacter hydrogenoformans DSM 2784]
MKNRYQRNMNLLTPDENHAIREKRVCVVGCGGLGGYIIEMLARLGIGIITAIDGDVFDETNLNRQLLSEEGLIGKSKAEAAKARIQKVNSEVVVHTKSVFLKEENALALITGHDVVLDALDNISSRRILERACEAEGIPLIHGAIAGWYGQVTTIMPGTHVFSKLYPETADKGIETELGNPSFTPALVASIQVSEALKVLLKKGEPLEGKLLTLNLLDHEYQIFEF